MTTPSNSRETEKTTKSNMPDNQTRQPPTKKKRLSNSEKGISLICSTLNEMSKILYFANFIGVCQQKRIDTNKKWTFN